MFKPFSKRGAQPPGKLRYDFTDVDRQRTMNHFGFLQTQGILHLEGMLEDVGRQCLLAYGSMKRAKNTRPANTLAAGAEDHFFSCSDEEVIDFLEFCFRSEAYVGQQAGVDTINDLFRGEGIGYEFSPYVVNRTMVAPVRQVVSPIGVRFRVDVQYPEATRKSNELLHSTTVMPALQLLSGAKFKIANEEMLKAHEDYRNGDFAHALTMCGSALESVLKIICDHKGWQYRPEKDTIAPLVDACRTNNLFPAPYVELLKDVGKLRNTLSSAHGRATTAVPKVDPEMVEHMIQIVSANILLLAKLAGMR